MARLIEAERERQRPPAPPTTLPAAPSKRDLVVGRQGGSDYFRTVNARAFGDLSAWVSALFGADAKPTSLGYRVSSAALGRWLEKDLSITTAGAKYFGVHDLGDARGGGRSAIDLIIEYGRAPDAVAAAEWLCRQIGTAPAALGWSGLAEVAVSADESEAASTAILRAAGMADGPSTGNGASDAAKPASACRIVAKPYVWRDPTTFPRREWLYGHHLIRKFVSTTIAPGAVRKSSLTMVEAVAMASGRNLLGVTPAGRMRVWVWNGEDPLEELERRVAAILPH